MTGSRPSGSRASQRRRSEIVDATRQLLREREADKVLVTDVAERAGVSVATIYNLVGTRDHLLVTVLDAIVDELRDRLDDAATGVAEARPVVVAPAIDACTTIAVEACRAVLADPVPHRRALGALGQLAPDVWLLTGLGDLFRDAIEGAVASGALTERIALDAVARSVLFGFRGALISWVFGQLDDERLALEVEAQVLHVLANAATTDLRAAAIGRITELASNPGRT